MTLAKAEDVRAGGACPRLAAVALPLIGCKLAADGSFGRRFSADEVHARVALYAKDAARWILSKGRQPGGVFRSPAADAHFGAAYYKGEVAANGLRAFARAAGERAGSSRSRSRGRRSGPSRWGSWSPPLYRPCSVGPALQWPVCRWRGFLTALMFVLAVAQSAPGREASACRGLALPTGETTTATVFLVWSLFVGTIDNVVRPFLIKSGADRRWC